MALKDHTVRTADSQAGRQKSINRPFAEIDARQFRRAQKDPDIQRLHAAADRHLEQLEAEGRIEF